MNILNNDIYEIEQYTNILNFTPITKLKNNKTIIELINHYNLNINDFYKTNGKLYPYCYFKGFILIEIYDMSKKFFNDFRIVEIIKQRNESMNKFLLNKQYEEIFTFIDKPLRFIFYKSLFDKIPDNQKYSVFKSVYTSSEYGFNQLSRDFLDKIFKYNIAPKEWFRENVITIYRGEGDKSTSYTEACSWTINKEIADFFAHRFDSDGIIYKAKVRQQDILDYINDRNEQEILVFPENVYDVEEYYI
ncbi:MAG: hypothetical protein LIR50_17575 [Bacillota bacterium]|nr:hypothetical protein [Bacillota bacterium]